MDRKPCGPTESNDEPASRPLQRSDSKMPSRRLGYRLTQTHCSPAVGFIANSIQLAELIIASSRLLGSLGYGVQCNSATPRHGKEGGVPVRKMKTQRRVRNVRRPAGAKSIVAAAKAIL